MVHCQEFLVNTSIIKIFMNFWAFFYLSQEIYAPEVPNVHMNEIYKKLITIK